MNVSPSIAPTLSIDARKRIALLSLVKAEPVAHLADQEGVSRQFIYWQKHKVAEALDQTFAANDAGVLFNLPVTQAWLDQLMLSLTLICRSSCRGVKELLRDMFDGSVSVGTIHNRLRRAAGQAAAINRAQDLSAIRVGLHDEIYQGSIPVLAGVDAASTYCYLLASAGHRDADTWGVHLLDVCTQGFDPDHTMADTPCHGDVFHIEQQCQSLVNVLARLAKGAVSRRRALDVKMDDAKESDCGNTLSRKLALARQAERQAVQLARDVKTLVNWASHDIFALAAPYLDYLIEARMTSVALSKNFIVPIYVPSPARFAVHKLFSCMSRTNQFANSEKDIRQAATLICALEERYPGDVADAMTAFPNEGRVMMVKGASKAKILVQGHAEQIGVAFRDVIDALSG